MTGGWRSVLASRLVRPESDPGSRRRLG